MLLLDLENIYISNLIAPNSMRYERKIAWKKSFKIIINENYLPLFAASAIPFAIPMETRSHTKRLYLVSASMLSLLL